MSPSPAEVIRRYQSKVDFVNTDYNLVPGISTDLKDELNHILRDDLKIFLEQIAKAYQGNERERIDSLWVEVYSFLLNELKDADDVEYILGYLTTKFESFSSGNVNRSVEVEFSSMPILRKFVMKYSGVKYEAASSMSKDELIRAVWTWVVEAVSYQTVEASASLAMVDIAKVEYADIQPGITLHKILQDLGSSEAQSLFDQINAYIWSINAGYLKTQPEVKKLSEYTRDPNTATERFRLEAILWQMHDPVIAAKGGGYPDVLPGNEPLKAGVPLGELIREGVKFSIERELINEYISRMKELGSTARDGSGNELKKQATPFYNEELWRSEIREYYIDQLSDDPAIQDQLRNSSLIDVLPRFVFNLMETLYFRALFDLGALKIDPDTSDHVQLARSRGKVISVESHPARGGKKIIKGRSVKGGPGKYELTTPNFVRSYLPPVLKYLHEFLPLNIASTDPSEAQKAHEVVHKIREFAGIIGLDDSQTNELIQNVFNKGGERKTIFQWILDDTMPACLIPINSTPGFQPGSDKNSTGWPTNYTTIEGNVVNHAESMRKVAYGGMGAEADSAIDWKKMLRMESRSNGSHYAALEQNQAVVGTKNWRDVWYYFCQDNSFMVTKEWHDHYHDFWFSSDEDKRKQAIQYGYPFPLKSYNRDPSTGEPILDAQGNLQRVYFISYVPVQMFHFFNENDLKEMLSRKEITTFQRDLYKSHWPRIISTDTEDQFMEMMKCMYEIQLVAELRDIPNEEWTVEISDAVMQFLSFEHWNSATRTAMETIGAIADGKLTIVDLYRSILYAKRNHRFINPIIDRFSPAVEDRRYNGLGFWSREEVVNIFKAAGKIYPRKAGEK